MYECTTPQNVLLRFSAYCVNVKRNPHFYLCLFCKSYIMWYFLHSWSTELIKQVLWCLTPNMNEWRNNRRLLFLLTAHNPPLFLLHTHSDTQNGDRGGEGNSPSSPHPLTSCRPEGLPPSQRYTHTGMWWLTRLLIQLNHVYLITLHQLEFTKASSHSA